MTQTLSTETVHGIYRKLNQIAGDLNTIRWQLIQPLEESDRHDLRNDLKECITQAQIALDNLNTYEVPEWQRCRLEDM